MKTYPGDKFWDETRGKKFVAIGENRAPKKGEFFLQSNEFECVENPEVGFAMFDYGAEEDFPIMKEETSYLAGLLNKAGKAVSKFTKNSPSAHAGHKHICFESVADLADGLNRAKDAHSQFERTYGSDPNWPLWYASFLAMEQGMGVSEYLIPQPKCAIGAGCKVEPQTKGMEVPEKEGTKEEYWKIHE